MSDRDSVSSGRNRSWRYYDRLVTGRRDITNGCGGWLSTT